MRPLFPGVRSLSLHRNQKYILYFIQFSSTTFVSIFCIFHYNLYNVMDNFCEGLYRHVCMCGGHKSISDLFLYSSPPCILRQGLSLDSSVEQRVKPQESSCSIRPMLALQAYHAQLFNLTDPLADTASPSLTEPPP